MPFAVDDFQDLLRLLEQHPEWRAELRRHVLTDELLELPAVVRQLADQMVALTAKVDTLADQMVVLTARVDALTAGVDALAAKVEMLADQMIALTARVDALTARVDALTARVDALAAKVDTLADQIVVLTVRMDTLADQMGTLAHRVGALSDQVGILNGDVLELRYARRYAAYFSRLAHRLRLIEHSRLADLLDDAVEEQRLSETERESAMEADLVLTGRRREDGEQAYFVVELSVGVGVWDVQRALDRAQIVAKLGQPAVPVVAGEWINPEATRMAEATGVQRVLHPRPPPPDYSQA